MKTLVIRLGAIGDMMFITPVLAALKARGDEVHLPAMMAGAPAEAPEALASGAAGYVPSRSGGPACAGRHRRPGPIHRPPSIRDRRALAAGSSGLTGNMVSHHETEPAGPIRARWRLTDMIYH